MSHFPATRRHPRLSIRSCAAALALVLPVIAFVPAARADGVVPQPVPVTAIPGTEDAAAQLSRLLHLDAVIAQMQDEGADYAEGVEADLFPDEGGAAWIEEVRALYDPARTTPLFDAAFRQRLAGQDTAPMIAFFEAGSGAKAVPLELAARHAMLDPEVEDEAKLAAGELMVNRDPRATAIRDFVEAGGLVEANVVGGLNANLAFWQGLNAGGAFPEPMAEEDVLSQVGAQEEAIRAETRDWLYAYLTLAYKPLSDGELADYTAFSGSGPGRALNEAVFAGFSAVFRDVSFRMGQGAARRIAGQEL